MKNKGRGAIWIVGLAVLMVLVAFAGRLFVGSVGAGLSWALGLACSVGLWWWTGRLMTRSEIRWRALLPTAVLCGVGSWIYTLAATVWMPSNLANQFAQFGAFGISLAFVTWFTGMAFLVVGAAALGPVLTEGDGWLGRWLRNGRESVLEDGAAPSLPGPIKPLRLADAFARGRRTDADI